MKTLIIIDMQNDFMPGGALAVPKGDLIVPVINRIQPFFDLVVATQDWHPANHKSFASNHKDRKPFEQIILHGLEQTLWPEHCIQGTAGAAFHPQLETLAVEAIFRKGLNSEIDSYSCFYDNAKRRSTGLTGFLREKKATKLYFSGLCSDICVYFSIKDALDEGFQCVLVEDAAQPLDTANYPNIREELLQQGVAVIQATEI